MRIHRFLPAFCLFSLATPVAAQTVEAGSPPPATELTVSGGATVASQYRFRGISLSDEKAAIQGTINLNHNSGAYAGVWGSNIDGLGAVGDSHVEFDIYGGWKGDVAPGTKLEAGVLYYAYPGATGGHFEFFEPYAQLSHQFGSVNANAGVNFAPSQKALGHNSNVYVHGELAAPIPATPLTLKGHIGHSKGKTSLSPMGVYTDWSLGAEASWKNLTAGIAWVSTDLNEKAAIAAGTRKSVFGSAAVVSLSTSFGPF